MRTLFISNDKCKKCYGKGYIIVVKPLGNKMFDRILHPCVCLRPVDDTGIEAIHQEMLKRKEEPCPPLELT